MTQQDFIAKIKTLAYMSLIGKDGSSMTKADLISIISGKAHLDRKRSERVINFIFDLMAEAMKKDERVEIRGFGSFVNRRYDSYTGRNQKTGESVTVPPKVLPFFKVGKELRELVDSGSSRT